jgi:hypothetical protein
LLNQWQHIVGLKFRRKAIAVRLVWQQSKDQRQKQEVAPLQTAIPTNNILTVRTYKLLNLL